MDENFNRDELLGFDTANTSNENNQEDVNVTSESELPSIEQPVFRTEETQNSNSDFTSSGYNQYYSSNSIMPPRKPQKKYGFGTIIVAAVLAAVIGAISGIGAVFAGNLLTQEDDIPLTSDTSSTTSQIGGSTVNITVDKTAESVIEAVAQKVTPSVVGIRTMAAVNSFFGSSEETTGEGSGVIYSKDGYIITNYHVIESAVGSSSSTIQVFLADNSEEAINATVVGYNITNDLAVIKIQTNKALQAVELGSSENLKVGQFVAAIGNPGGLEFMGSVTYGIISGLNRTISDGDSAYLIQTDAAINPGNSGGALVNTKGQLVGINSSKIVSESYEGMGFAIPVSSVKEICDKIIAKEYDPAPYMGITISERYDAQTLQYLNYPVGAVVQSIVSGGPADEAKIKRGDIITEFNGTKITDYTVFSDALDECKPGQTVTVVIYRSGRYYSTSVKIGANNSQ